MAKARAALLQLAHPKIAAGLAAHSAFDSDPYTRVRIKGQTMSAILFGSDFERREALRLLRGLHARVQGTMPDGESYRATDPALMWFVLATLIDSDLLVDALYVHAFGERDRDAFYEESLVLVDAFRVPRSLVPSTRHELREHVNDAVAQLDVSDDARRLGSRIVNPTFLRAPRPLKAGYRLLIADLLPEPIRAGYGLGNSPFPAARLVGPFARATLPRLPETLRGIRLKPARPQPPDGPRDRRRP